MRKNQSGKLLFLLLAAFSFSTTFAQTKTITGIIKDDQQKPLSGATLTIKGTSTSAVSGENGQFQINTSGDKNTLVISYVGMQSKEVALTGQTNIQVSLLSSAGNLSDVVVIGYGSQRKTDVTSSIASADIKRIGELPVTGVEQALQGRVVGVQVTSTSGIPGSPVMVRIRGLGTVNYNDPLYVVDGVPVNGMNYLNPSDVASIDVLKDASAAAIYGNRAANGVILITTKKGRGKAMVTANMYYATSKPWKNYTPADREEYMYMSKAVNGEGSAAYAKALDEYNKGYGTDWWSETVSSAPTTNYDLGISGSTDKMHYSMNGSYFDQQGSISPSRYQRVTFRINTDYKIRDWWKIGENVSVSNEKRPRTINNIFASVVGYDPLVPVFDATKSAEDQADPYNKYAVSSITFGSNPLALLARQIGEDVNLRTVSNLYTDINFTNNLVFNSNFGIDLSRRSSSSFSPSFYMSPSDQNTLRSASAGSYQSNYWVWANTLTWSPKIGDNSFNILAGASFESTKWKNVGGSSTGQPSNDPSDWFLDAGTAGNKPYGSAGSAGLNSYFARLIYSYQNKYLLTSSIRHDGTSQFSPENRWGTFPAVSVGWIVSKENFWEGLGAPWFSNFKIRGGWGQLGNQTVPGANNYATYIAGGDNRRYVVGNDGSIQQGYSMDNLGNAALHWETTDQADAGIEAGFFNNRLTFTAEYFNRKTNGMIVSLPVADVFGVSSPIVNIGSVKNNGFEFTFNYDGKAGKDITYSIGSNLSTYKNTVVSLGLSAPYVDDITGSRVNGFSRTAVGRPIGEFYGFKTNGIFQSQEEVDSYKSKTGSKIQPSARPGDFRFVDVNDDGAITDDDKTTIGSPHPDFLYAFNGNVNYKNFDLAIYFQGSAGNENFNINKYFTNQPIGFGNIQKGVAYAAWTPENHSNTQPVMSINDPNNNYRTSDWYVEDGSYLRLKTLQIGYTFRADASAFLEKLSFSDIRLYIAFQNLLTFTKYSGLDPEIGPYATDAYNNFDNAKASRLMGADYGTFPNPRTFQVGVSLKF